MGMLKGLVAWPSGLVVHGLLVRAQTTKNGFPDLVKDKTLGSHVNDNYGWLVLLSLIDSNGDRLPLLDGWFGAVLGLCLGRFGPRFCDTPRHLVHQLGLPCFRPDEITNPVIIRPIM